jgi:folate receptor
MIANYGPEYAPDRCGPISDACYNFFVMEECFYECDPTAGLYRKYSDQQVAADIAANGTTTWTNTWEMYNMPIQISFCNAWYDACYNDLFCSVSDGDFFSCEYLTVTAVAWGIYV